MSKYMDSVKTLNSVADAYREMKNPIKSLDDKIEEELLESILVQAKQEEIDGLLTVDTFDIKNDYASQNLSEGRMGDIFQALQDGDSAQEIAKQMKIPLAVAKSFIQDFKKHYPKDYKVAYESVEINEVTDKEINAMKKLSKDMQGVLKGYQKIAKMGDKELMSKEHNESYKRLVDARDKILTLIGTLNNKKVMKKEDVELYDRVLEEGTWAVPDSLSKIQTLNKLLSKPLRIKTEKDMDKAWKNYAGLVGDDNVADAWYKMTLEYSDVKKVGDAREPVVDWLKEWGFKLAGFKITHAPGSYVSGMDDDEKQHRGVSDRPSNIAKYKNVDEGFFQNMWKKVKGRGKIKKPKGKDAKSTKIDEAYSKNSKSGAEVAKMMMKSKTMKGFANKVKKMKTVTADQLDKMLPDYVSGGDIDKMFKEELSNQLEGRTPEERDAIVQDYIRSLNEVTIGDAGIQKDFPNVWATKDKRLYIILRALVNRDGYMPLLKLYKKDKAKFIKTLKDIGKRNNWKPNAIESFDEIQEKFRQSVPSDKNLVDFEVYLDRGDADKSIKAVELLCKKNGWKHQKTVDVKRFTTKPTIDVYSHWLTWEDDPKDERAIRLTVVANQKSKNYKDVDLSPAFKTTQLLNSAQLKNMYAEETETISEKPNMAGSKLTGQEISTYFRKNKIRDKTVKKAVEIALDHGGAMTYAMKEIEKLKKGLSKNKDVVKALNYANFGEGYKGFEIAIREALSPKDKIKLAAFTKQLSTITGFPLTKSADPETQLDRLFGQIRSKGKFSPASWEKIQGMVGLLDKIGVKLSSLKGFYMGFDPKTRKGIYHEEIKNIKEDIEEIVEAQTMSDADVKKISDMTDRNDHTGSILHLAKILKDKKSMDVLKSIIAIHKVQGHMHGDLSKFRNDILNNLLKVAKTKYRNYADIYSAF